MNNWHILVIEDSDFAIEAIKEHIKSLMMYQTTICKTLEEAIIALRQRTYDLVLLDLELANNQFGIDLVKVYPNLPPTIITSSHTDYAIEAFDLDVVVDFLPKPFSQARFLRAVQRALSVKYTPTSIVSSETIYLKEGRQMTKFTCADILYAKAYGIYSKLYTVDKMVLINESLASLEETLPSKNFRRLHKSFIVNLDKVTGFNNKYFYIDTQKIPIGVTYKEDLEHLMNLVNNNKLE